jgi:hypothetical protein
MTFELNDITDGIALRDVRGLDPVKATLVTSSSAQSDGTQYHSAKRGDRNLIVQLDLVPDYVTTSVEDLRDRLYDFFMPKTEVKLKLYRHTGLVVDISGRIETCESPLFAKDPEMDISIICFNPDFVDLTEVEFTGDTTSGSDVDTLVYPGNIETGVKFVLDVNRNLTEFTIYHTRPDGIVRSTDIAVSMVTGDTLEINSIRGQKGVFLTRAGTKTSVLYGMSAQSAWMELLKGENDIRVYAEGAAIPYTITYTTKYGAL